MLLPVQTGWKNYPKLQKSFQVVHRLAVTCFDMEVIEWMGLVMFIMFVVLLGGVIMMPYLQK